MRLLRTVLPASFYLLLIVACHPKQVVTSSAAGTSYISLKGVDYSDENNWAALPQKKDFSDSIPAPLLSDYHRDTSVDVFFIHPTTFTNKEATEWNASIEDAALNEKTDRSTILFQASVFNRYNIYAPRYRQAHIRAYFGNDSLSGSHALELAYGDIKKAFDYYLTHKNAGKPLIIAAHSQGTTHAKRLLAEYFDNKPLQKQLVVAYLIGIPVAAGSFQSIPVCNDSLQTGCFLTWRTFRRGFEPDYNQYFRQSVVVNPLNWKTDTSYAAVPLHRGAILRDFNTINYHVNDAQSHKDLLWVSRPRFPGSRFYRSKNYHIGDYNLFYLNIRENLDQRVRAYKSDSIGHR